MISEIIALVSLCRLKPTIFFYGDALTEERARNVQWMFRDGDCEVDRLEGLDPVHTDWHAKVKLYEVIRYLH